MNRFVSEKERKDTVDKWVKFWTEGNLKYYKKMAEMFPNEPIWRRAKEDCEIKLHDIEKGDNRKDEQP